MELQRISGPSERCRFSFGSMRPYSVPRSRALGDDGKPLRLIPKIENAYSIELFRQKSSPISVFRGNYRQPRRRIGHRVHGACSKPREARRAVRGRSRERRNGTRFDCRSSAAYRLRHSCCIRRRWRPPTRPTSGLRLLFGIGRVFSEPHIEEPPKPEGFSITCLESEEFVVRFLAGGMRTT